MGWEFIYKQLEFIGVGPNFINMVKAANASTSSAILVQDELSEPFQLKRSARQGFPLSPLLYLIVANTLSWMLIKASRMVSLEVCKLRRP